MGWQPSRPMVAAEQRVDFQAHETHIDAYRARVERVARFTLRRLGSAIVTSGYPSRTLVDRLEGQIVRELDRTAVFGYAQAQREIAAMRKVHNQPYGITARRRGTPRSVPDAGQYGRLAVEGLPGAHRLIRHRAHEAMVAVVTAAASALQAADRQAPEAATKTAVVLAAARELHNHVLELIGETLNLGRTAGALRYPQAQGGPPEFAMRSEQLDKRTCGACDQLHGTITRVGSADYFSYLPPSGCSGGGRCRGIQVFADGPDDIRGPDTAPGPQPLLPPLGPDL